MLEFIQISVTRYDYLFSLQRDDSFQSRAAFLHHQATPLTGIS